MCLKIGLVMDGLLCCGRSSANYKGGKKSCWWLIWALLLCHHGLIAGIAFGGAAGELHLLHCLENLQSWSVAMMTLLTDQNKGCLRHSALMTLYFTFIGSNSCPQKLHADWHVTSVQQDSVARLAVSLSLSRSHHLFLLDHQPQRKE
jgi:hypothetical protein